MDKAGRCATLGKFSYKDGFMVIFYRDSCVPCFSLTERPVFRCLILHPGAWKVD